MPSTNLVLVTSLAYVVVGVAVLCWARWGSGALARAGAVVLVAVGAGAAQCLTDRAPPVADLDDLGGATDGAVSTGASGATSLSSPA